MELISFPRTGLDGILYSREDIERLYKSNLVKEISAGLDDIQTVSYRENACVALLKRQLEWLLIASPASLERIKKWSERQCLYGPNGDARTDSFKKEVLKAFGYDDRYRGGHLVKHAERLNVKTCCYCNLNYTLLIEERKARSISKKALMQFDHFYDKDLYPHLSMSMYNLIPCCGTCNQGKPRSGDLPIYFNPYHASILEMYKFKVKDPLQLHWGYTHPEKIEVECIPQTKYDISACDSWFHLSAKYSVHKDIVKEVFDKAQQYPYYANFGNFSFLKQDASYPLRLLLGVYADAERQGKRPMSKFITDLWEQACLYKAQVEDRQ